MSSVLSFRDPSRRLFTAGKRVLRMVDGPAISDVMALLIPPGADTVWIERTW